MEDTIIKEAPPIPTMGKWCEEEVLKLGPHFHKFNGSDNQYDRVTHFSLNDQENFKKLNGIGTITSVHICMALNNPNKNEITFCPYLEINGQRFDLNPETNGSFRSEENEPGLLKAQSDIVPGIFRNMIWENWEEAEMHLMDDLFHCKDKNGLLRRVEYYFITDNMIEVINDLNKRGITGITLYPGIDMNKFNKRDKISFTPVLGFTTGTSIKVEGRNKWLGILESNGDETLIEYSRPCPPTCP